MLELINVKKDDIDMSKVKGGEKYHPPGICADCDNCGTVGNDDTFAATTS